MGRKRLVYDVLQVLRLNDKPRQETVSYMEEVCCKNANTIAPSFRTSRLPAFTRSEQTRTCADAC